MADVIGKRDGELLEEPEDIEFDLGSCELLNSSVRIEKVVPGQRVSGQLARQLSAPSTSSRPEALMPNPSFPSVQVNEHSVQESLAKAGAKIHAITGIVAMYRAAVAEPDELARAVGAEFERALRRFVATGELS